VRLEPLAREHAGALAEASLGHGLFRYFPFALEGRQALASYVDAIDRANRRAEIGGTWLAPPWQRTPLNSEAKYLMLRHAFERAGLNRVEFKTDSRNARSRAALARIGATEEGTFRRHMVMPDGALRDSVWFSVIAEDWPSVRARLERLLARGEGR
jgi:RimJ/RimL family protein N-acetyltransferase